MLIQFSVENYRSIRDTVTIDFVAQKLKSHDPRIDDRNVAEFNRIKLLKSIGIYGANASGKSNIIKALQFFDKMVTQSASKMQKGDKIEVEPFLLNEEYSKKPSLFELIFLLEGIKYRYGFLANQERIEEEWLYWTPKSHERRIFTRELDKIKGGEDFSEAQSLQKFLRSNALFLSVAAQFNSKIPTKIIDAFSSMFFLDGTEIQYRGLSVRMLEKSFIRDDIHSFLKAADLCIDSVTLGEKGKLSDSERQALSEKSLQEMIIDSRQIVNTWHHKFNNQGEITGTEKFDLDTHESNGTKKLFALSALLITTLKVGGVLIIDEIDSQLHPMITLSIIRMFNSKASNPKNAQLLFVTHDTNLLDSNVLRRDQIWFAEKDKTQATEYYSLSDYKIDGKSIRNDASFEKNYISGKYGAIPYLGSFDFFDKDIIDNE
ncbi:ATP-binding protein [Deinococcus sp. LM3]|uniref:AAA family ATPase n=1 Tax=Deinococcus sp. LM3 TaxID=1938608 RepID=UPI0009935167|nr:ATP-binding protein [Deinococcus sp. LM3]OOV14434.1 hypothetical protein BXU09_06885 [Deinococcus sp. LM3]